MTNETNQTGKAGIAAGILANSANNKSNPGVITFKNCVNRGELFCGKDTGKNNYVGGICGYIYGTSTQYGVFENCVNTGTLHMFKFAGQIVTYTNTPSTTIKNCVGAGKIVKEADAMEGYPAVFVGFSKADFSQYAIEGNKLVKDDGTEYYGYTRETEEQYTKNIIAISAADPAKVAIVEAAEATAAVNAITNLGASGRLGAQGTIGYVDPNAASTDPGTTVITGDSAVIVMIIAAVSLLGMGIALKARKA